MNSSSLVGRSAPLGATIRDGGANFSVFSRTAAGIDLLLFDHAEDAAPSRTISLDVATDCTYFYWHQFVPGLKAGQLYAYRARGPFDPGAGLRFDAAKILLDPYSKGVVVPSNYDRQAARKRGDNTSTGLKSVIVDPSQYDWEGDEPLRRPAARTIIYEMHVGGFTRNPNSGVSENLRGTYAGLIEKIPYLQQLGITAVELLPVFQFDAQDSPPGLVNYWGYQPVSYFAPHQAYSSRPGPLGAVDEFRDMVKALHRAGIEVILDVVFNHSSEGDHDGPTFCFRGLDNPTYYILGADRSAYADYTGCGNTLNANNPIVRRMIVDSIRYWVEHMHVDGFRFDLASILARDSTGQVLSNPPVLWDIESDPELAGTKLIAEAWDAAGLNQVGTFAGDSWKEWNGHFRDDVRAFFRAEAGSLRRFADRLVGSPGIYGREMREPEQSVNFVTCHDGFTMNDLVSYDRKHNEANEQDNRDGTDNNVSWNCGAEGPTNDPAIEKLRNRQVKNFLAATIFAVGMPMILMGDEVRRTQNGNNNNYCHDDATAWLDWSLVERHADVHRFVSLLNARRMHRTDEPERKRLTLQQWIDQSTKYWHGVKLNSPDWSDSSRSAALTVKLFNEQRVVHFLFNAYWEPLDFELEKTFEGQPIAWRRWIDTALDSPNDIVEWENAPLHSQNTYHAEARSTVALIGDSQGNST